VILFFLPIGLDRKYKRFPAATALLCGVNLLVYIVLAKASGWPYLSVSTQAIYQFALYPQLVNLPDMIYAMFTNVDIVHVLMNVIFLWVFGSLIEEEVGIAFLVALYIIGGLAAELAQIAIVQLLLSGTSMTAIAGASGGVSCLLGVFAVRYSHLRVRVFYSYWIVLLAGSGVVALGAWVGIGLWLALQVALGGVDVYLEQTMGIGHFAHLGAFVLGMAIAGVGGMAGQAKWERRRARVEADLREGPLGEAHAAELSLLEAPEDPRRHLDAGRAWAQLDDREKASEHYTAALTLAIATGDRGLAVDVHDAAREDAVEFHMTPRERFTLASALMDADRFSDACDHFDAVCESDAPCAEKPVALLRSAQIRLDHLGRPEDGERRLRMFIEQYPGDEWEAYARSLLEDAERKRGTGIGSRPRPMKGPK
jgi:membrane associated rhomboid family serine protease